MGTEIESHFARLLPLLAQTFEKDGHKLTEIQVRVIEHFKAADRTLCIMPTGGGKSLIYWLSCLIEGGTALVISPLVALIDEQVQKLKGQGIDAFALHGGTARSERDRFFAEFYSGKRHPAFIFVSPERLATDGLFRFCVRHQRETFKSIVVDEIHCVSQWGQSFRPFYKRIPDFIRQVFGPNSPKLMGLTATLNPKEIVEICDEFSIDRNNIIRDDLIVRSEIELSIHKVANENQKDEKLWKLLDVHRGEKTLVYLYRRYNTRGTEGLHEAAVEKGHRSAYFHSDLSAADRQEVIARLRNNEIDVVFATNAFGMGIDIQDIRNVIHYMLPESVEQYYQEVGRSARDKKAAKAYLCYSNKNIEVRKKNFIDSSFPDRDCLERAHKRICAGETGFKSLQYFDEDDELQRALPYLIGEGVVEIRAVAFTSLEIFKNIDNVNIRRLYELTKTKSFVSTVKKSGRDAQEIADDVYDAVLTGKCQMAKNKDFDKCLIVYNHADQLTEGHLSSIERRIDDQRKYRHELFDYFVHLIESYDQSKTLHQDIGLYLGADRHKLGCIFKTRKGDLVRSKSEVIIANLLFESNIDYAYEKKLFYEGGKYIEPDFTIKLGTDVIYWEHLGMIGADSYDDRWLKKKEIYERFFPGRLRKTYESAHISASASEMIESFKCVLDRRYVSP
jgi:ATP-dependent DNA helicase RecQ